MKNTNESNSMRIGTKYFSLLTTFNLILIKLINHPKQKSLISTQMSLKNLIILVLLLVIGQLLYQQYSSEEQERHGYVSFDPVYPIPEA